MWVITGRQRVRNLRFMYLILFVRYAARLLLVLVCSPLSLSVHHAECKLQL